MNRLKKFAKKYMPKQARKFIGSAMRQKEIAIAYRYDRRKFLKYYSKPTLGRNSQTQLAARMTFHAHAIEKGLSHQKVRLGFGRTALENLSSVINAYISLGYSKDEKSYINALSVIREYIKLHKSLGYETGYISDIFSKKVLTDAAKTESVLGGVIQITSNTKIDNGSVNFKTLFENRWSVREYAETPVDKHKIDETIELAMKTPSICNRQSSRATVLYDKDVMKKVLAIQDGITGYELPPALIMISTDTSAFTDINERNQIYIDGGLFAMAVLMGLEYASLAACPLNAMLSVKRDKQMRKVLNIPKNENIIMFISVGNFLENNTVPRSFRYSGSEVSRTFK